jgi:hypothetical protein
MSLCEEYRYGSSFPDYTIHDTKGMFAKYGHNNVDVSWSDFRKALIKHQLQSPPGKPSVFHGEWFPPDHTIKMRKRGIGLSGIHLGSIVGRRPVGMDCQGQRRRCTQFCLCDLREGQVGRADGNQLIATQSLGRLDASGNLGWWLSFGGQAV